MKQQNSNNQTYLLADLILLNMRKGFEWSVNLVAAVILGVVAAGIFWSALNGSTAPVAYASPTPVKLDNSCKSDNDCTSNLDGARCVVIYPGDFNAFCGCLMSLDCAGRRSGVCDSTNKCV